MILQVDGRGSISLAEVDMIMYIRMLLHINLWDVCIIVCYTYAGKVKNKQQAWHTCNCASERHTP